MFKKKSLNSAINFSIIVLFLTNLWIFLYQNILQFLNKNFPSIVPPGFFRSDVAPEPFEISLYIVLTVIFVFFIWLIHKYFPRNNFEKFIYKIPNTILITLSLILIFFLSFVFIKNIGNYPMGHDVYPYPTGEKQQTYFLVIFLYISIISVVLLESLVIEKLSNKSKWIFRVFMSIVILLVAAATFEPGFPMVGHDYSYFFGPVFEVLHKKTIYTDVSSQYGFLSILVIALLTKLHLINIWYLPTINWLFYVLEYSLCFLIIYKLTKSLTFSLVGLFSVLTLNYFSLYHLAASIPQIGPVRWLPLVFFIFLFTLVKKINSTKLILALAILSFWIIDIGIFLTLAYFATILLLVFTKRLKIYDALIVLLTVILFSASFFIVINFLHIILGYKIINPIFIFAKINEYAKAGFGMIPIDKQTYFWLILLIYFSSIIVFLKKNTEKFASELLILTANLSLFASIYFVGRSNPHNLFHISTFPLLNLFVLIAIVWKDISNLHLQRILLVLLFILLIAFPATQRQEVITKVTLNKLQRLYLGNIFKPYAYEIMSKKYAKDIKFIQQNLPDRKILILSDDDTYLFYLTDKENYLFDNSAETIITQDALNRSLSDFLKNCPRKIVIDCNLAGLCNYSDPYTINYFKIQPIILDKIESLCRVRYEPIKCSDHLCIAQSKPI